MRRFLRHCRTIFCRRVAGADQRPDFHTLDTTHSQILLNGGQRLLQIDLNVVAQRLERRNVNNLGFVAKFAGDCFRDQIIDR